jgi:hypothetical protein
MARPRGLEPLTAGFEDRNSSIELKTDIIGPTSPLRSEFSGSSDRRNDHIYLSGELVLLPRIELDIHSYQECVIPFNYRSLTLS